MLMSNLHIDLVVAFWGGIPVILAIARTRLGGVFHEYTDGGFAVFYGAASLDVREQFLQSVY